ncbi:MAG: response regulator [Ekhidna sp.]|nr:response regulator [Ekhidna sp.]
MKGIIFEDNFITSMALEMILQDQGFTCLGKYETADNLASLIDQHAPDFILMDNKLAGQKSGVKAIEELRLVSDIPVVFLSASSDHKVLKRVTDISNSSFVNKPFQEDLIIQEIKSLTEAAN